MIHGVHVGHEIQDLVGIAPFVVVPGDELDEVVVQHDAGSLIEDAGLGKARQIGGDHLVGGAGDDALHGIAGGVLHGHAHIVVAGRLDQPGGEIHHRDVVGGHPEAHARHLSLEFRDYHAHRLGGAGGGGDDVAHDAAAGAPVTTCPGVHSLLLGGGGMDGGHQSLGDAERVVDDLGHGSQAVGGAGGVGHHIHIRRVELVVDAHDESGGHIVLGRCGNDDLLGPVVEVGGGLFHGAVSTGGFDNVLGAAVIPGNLGGVVIAVDPDLLAVDDEVAVIPLHGTLERPEYGVVLYLVDHVVQIRVAQVDAPDLVAAASPFHHDPQSHASNAAEAVNPNLNRHRFNPSQSYLRRVPPAWAVLISLYHSFRKIHLIFT